MVHVSKRKIIYLVVLVAFLRKQAYYCCYREAAETSVSSTESEETCRSPLSAPTNLANSTTSWNGDFQTFLGGTSVTINGKAAYLSFVSAGQINLQAPTDTATAIVPVVVTTAGGSSEATVRLAQFGPSFFLIDDKHVAGIIVRSDGSGAYGGGSYDIIGPTGTSRGYPTIAAKAGDIVELYGTGLGPTNPPAPAGQVFYGTAPTTNPVRLRIGNASVVPTFAGLSGAGVY